MIQSIAILVSVLSAVPAPGASPAGEFMAQHAARISQEAQQRGMRRVVVCPRGISPRDSEAEGQFGGQMKALGDYFAQKLYDGLLPRLGAALVAPQDARKVFEGLTAAQLDRREVQARIRGLTGADGLVVLSGASPNQTAWYSTETALYDLRTPAEGSPGPEAAVPPVASVSMSGEHFLSDAAYEGRSFEVCRWSGGRLQPVGLNPLVAPEPLGLGAAEKVAKMHLTDLVARSGHPLADPSLPYRFAVVVEGQERTPERIGGELYVRLEPGEEYWIKIVNNCGEKVFMGIWVDGLNVCGSRLEGPRDVPIHRLWVMENGRTGALHGWYELNDRGTVYGPYHRFQVSEPSQAVAVREGAGDSLGMLTCVVYSDAAAVKDASRGMGVGTGEGRSGWDPIEYGTGEKGVLLATVTLYYRTGEELEAMKYTSRGAAAAANAISSP